MIEVWRFKTEEGRVVFVARLICCPFCDKSFEIHRLMTADGAVAWLEETHLPTHVEAMTDSQDPLCPRCERYAICEPILAPGDALHRRCFSPSCGCACSLAPNSEVVRTTEPNSKSARTQTAVSFSHCKEAG